MDPKVEKKQGFTDPNQTDLLGPDEDTGVRDLYIKKKENLSVFEKFIQKISDAFSSAYSTISRIFRSSDQQAAAISNINAQPIESSSNIYNKFESETPPNGPTAQSLFKIKEDLQEKGKEDFYSTLESRKKSTEGSHINIPTGAYPYARKLILEYEKKKINNPNYPVTVEERKKIKLICEICSIDEKKLLPNIQNPISAVKVESLYVENNSTVNVQVAEENNPLPISHPGKKGFEEFFVQWTTHNESWNELNKINNAQIIIESCANADCISYAEYLTNLEKRKFLKQSEERLDKLRAANYLIAENKKIKNKEQSKLKKEKKRAEIKKISSASENDASPVKKINTYPKKSAILFTSLIGLINKDDHAVLEKKLNSSVVMKTVNKGLEILIKYDPESNALSDLPADEISSLREVLIFINLLEKAFEDKNGNPLELRPYETGRIFKDISTYKHLEKIYTNRAEIKEILSKHNIAVTGNAVTSSALPISSPLPQNPPASLNVSVASAVPPKPLPPAPPPLPPIGGQVLARIPAFPTLIGENVRPIHDFLYPDKGGMEFNIFKEQIYNPAARYFKSQAKDRSTKISTSKNNDDKVKADIFSFQWQAAVESKRQAALAEFELINLYVNEHLKKI